MYKKLLSSLITIALLFAGCSNQTANINSSTQKDSDSSVPEIKPITEASDIQFWGQTIGTLGVGCGTQSGYYYIQETSGEYSNLMYIDYASKTYIPLCSRPECEHNDETCTSILAGRGSSLQITSNKNKLILIYSGADATYQDENQDAAFANIQIMNFDGTDKKTLVTLNANEDMQTGVASDDSFVYIIKSTHNGTEVKNALCSVSLTDGTLAEMYELPQGSSFMAGVRGRNIVIKSFSAPQGNDLYPDNSAQTFYCINADTNECIGQKALAFNSSASVPQALMEGTTQIIFYPDENTIVVEDIATGKQTHKLENVLEEKIQFGQIVRMFNNKIILSEVFEGKENAESFWIDITNGNKGKMTLSAEYDSSAHSSFPLVPSCAVDEMLLTVYKCSSNRIKLTSADGHLIQAETIIPYYAFIDAADYFANTLTLEPIKAGT